MRNHHEDALVPYDSMLSCRGSDFWVADGYLDMGWAKCMTRRAVAHWNEMKLLTMDHGAAGGHGVLGLVRVVVGVYKNPPFPRAT